MKPLTPQNLDRAFAKTPAAIHDNIIEAFERGESAMKFRHKVTTMVSAAAVLVVIVAVAALAAGGLGFGTPKQDIVLDQPITALPEPAPDVKDTIVYTHKKGIYYHAQSSCSGMKNAPETTLAQAEADGKTACPVCIRIDTAAAATPTPIPVHSTDSPADCTE